MNTAGLQIVIETADQSVYLNHASDFEFYIITPIKHRMFLPLLYRSGWTVR